MAFVYWIHLDTHIDLTKEGYIGVTSKTPTERWIQHKKYFRLESRRGCEALKNAYRKYGENLKVTPLVEASDEYCYEVEGKLRPSRSIGWNIAVGGTVSPMLGRRLSEEEKRKLSESRKGNPNYSRVISDEQKEFLSNLKRQFLIVTPDGEYTIKEAIDKYKVTKHTIYKRSSGCFKRYSNWGRKYIYDN